MLEVSETFSKDSSINTRQKWQSQKQTHLYQHNAYSTRNYVKQMNKPEKNVVYSLWVLFEWA